ncbi:dTDP-4-dehydrorhamnose reductase [Rubellimicrobium rubrum]|uniref:dTDP-4-dehydrorhamnose reductase n=1 Tax=Rubellimicrobium rubrum TaxID=2585369 RepID=A0A5C4MZQ3_9RHOB|nr:dTDP-4-dehydrorhamnose reductase [Rubellimicrobium rubrum]TNC50410.1 dTDP-4-dehydrorhamnose reductase [Rubellimicrobium rubrum]
MRVLLLGPNGQLGHDIQHAHAMAGEPFELISVRRDRLDVASVDAIGQTLADLEFNVLVNCTSYHKTDEVEHNAARAVAINAHAVKALAQACSLKKARFVHVSTDYVFGGDLGRDRPLKETHPTSPINVYGASKALGETLALHAHDDVVVLRVASLFGVAGASGKGGNFVETMIRAGREKGALRVVEDQVMSPTATADVAQGLVRMLSARCAPGIYHLVNSGAASWYEFACEIIRLAEVDAVVTPCSSAEYPTPAARPRYSVLDNAKASDLLGAVPSWHDSLARYLEAKGHMA